ncbi:acVLRF1 family peptidyl-tRNA hydrolase [uncultured Arsenicicoccus sp.]|uniref:acVLRF1 family peptidyl-tRNA hydrolase n=1 Tax=uncultured Arsenicicoccus sp. TaxID=491339 RepID=UPI00259A43CA|nr:acVLRF1 family peptidyl-tRNA hydrolase [uncultured Arsenicicoccus sp.]
MAPGCAPGRVLDVDPDRLTAWVGGFLDRHGPARWSHDGATVIVRAGDGAVARLDALDPAGSERVSSLRTLVGWPGPPPRLALVLVRRGRYAVGLADGEGLLAHTAGSRYVQSRTAAGGWSQQRYQRRRGNQADALVRHVADEVVRLAEPLGPGWARAVVLGGDRGLAEQVLHDPRLATWRGLPRREAFGIPDPTHAILRAELRRARAVRVTVVEPSGRAPSGGGMVEGMTGETMSHARELIPAAAAAVTDLVERIPADAWDRQSPCEDWTVRDVLGHLTSEHLWAPRLLGGETVEQVGDAYDGDLLGDDPAEAWRTAQTRSVLAFGAVEDDDQEVSVSSGSIPVQEYASQMLVDLTVHAWDLARGAGVDVTLVPAAVDECLAYANRTTSGGGVEGTFDAPVSTSSRDRTDQLVALLGRDPAWRG